LNHAKTVKHKEGYQCKSAREMDPDQSTGENQEILTDEMTPEMAARILEERRIEGRKASRFLQG
jgi:hypothetical protein